MAARGHSERWGCAFHNHGLPSALSPSRTDLTNERTLFSNDRLWRWGSSPRQDVCQRPLGGVRQSALHLLIGIQTMGWLISVSVLGSLLQWQEYTKGTAHASTKTVSIFQSDLIMQWSSTNTNMLGYIFYWKAKSFSSNLLNDGQRLCLLGSAIVLSSEMSWMGTSKVSCKGRRKAAQFIPRKTAHLAAATITLNHSF